MAIVTKISVQKRNKSRYNLFLDRGQGEEYAFSVDEDLLIKFGLKKGLELDEKELMKLIDEDEQKKAYHLSIHYLSYRMRSIEEVRAYLQKKESEEQHIEVVIKQLIDQRLLNDAEFADAFIRTKKMTLMKGPLKLKQELSQKGVQATVIDSALESFPVSEQIDQIIKWLEKQTKRNTKQSSEAFSNKLANQLLTKGYSRQVIMEAMKHVDLSKDTPEEYEALCHQSEKILRKYEGKYQGWEYRQRVKQALYLKGFSIELIDQFLNKQDSEK